MSRILFLGAIRHHIVDVEQAAVILGERYYTVTRICEGSAMVESESKLALRSKPIEEADLTNPLTCPDCATAHQAPGDGDEAMETIPLF